MLENVFERTTWGEPLPINEQLFECKLWSITTLENGNYRRLYQHQPANEVEAQHRREEFALPTNTFECPIPSDSRLALDMSIFGLGDDTRERFYRSRAYEVLARRSGHLGGHFNPNSSDWVLRTWLNFGDDAFSVTSDTDTVLHFAPTDTLWHLGGDEINIRHLSVAVRDAIWNSECVDDPRSNLNTLQERFSPIRVPELAFAVSRFPRILSYTLDSMTFETARAREALVTMRELIGLEGFAWFCEFARSRGVYPLSEPYRNDIAGWASRMKEHGLDFDTAIGYVSEGFYDPDDIADYVESGIDIELLTQLEEGAGK
jgi:hypothetical protein